MKKIFSFLTAILFVGSMWAADGDKHDFAQSLQQLLNGGASIASINIAEQSYPVKEVIVSYRYNNTKTDAVTMEVKVAGSSWGTFNVNGTDKSYYTESFTGDAIKGAIAIDFTNNTTAATKCGTFYVDKVTLVEGVSTTPEITVDPTSWDFGDVELDAIGSDDTKNILKSIALTGANLTDDVQISVETTGGGAIFFINGYRSTATLTPEEGSIDYELIAIASTATEGEFAGTITISSKAETPEFDDVVIDLAINVVAPIEVTGVELDKDAITLEIGQTQTLTATVLPAEATNKAVTWESSDETVATVVDGVVTAIAPGDATITCKSVAKPTLFATCAVSAKVHEITPGKYDDILLANSLWGTSYTSSTTSTSANALDLSGTTNDIEIGLTNGTSTSMYITNDGTRAYSGYTLTFSVPTGYNLTKITFTKASKWGLVNDDLNSDKDEWTGKANNVAFTFSGRTDFTTVSVTFEKSVPTAVENTDASVKAVKTIVNGQLLIEKNGRVYNAFGQTVK